MRGMFSVLGLLLVVAIIGVLVKKQMGSLAGPTALPTVSGSAPAPDAKPTTPQQTVQQFQQAVQGQMQQARPMPDDPK